jgi:hypothetical protein
MKTTHQIRKTILKDNYSVILNDNLGSVLELDNFNEASQLCQIMNVNSDNNCKYEIIVINNRNK